VSSLARPGGNATGINYFVTEVLAKRLGLLHELVPKAVRMTVLVNPTNAPAAEVILRDMPELRAPSDYKFECSTPAPAAKSRRPSRLLSTSGPTASSLPLTGSSRDRSSQFVTLASRDRIPTSCGNREMVEAGLLMSYGTDNLDMFHRVG